MLNVQLAVRFSRLCVPILHSYAPGNGVLALGPVLPLLVTECVTRARAELADPGPSLADVLAVAEAEEAAFLACPDWPGTGPGR